ncbi:MAG: branched-chain amino acid ABC transporter substrate-binding protein [Mycobacterium sp.]
MGGTLPSPDQSSEVTPPSRRKGRPIVLVSAVAVGVVAVVTAWWLTSSNGPLGKDSGDGGQAGASRIKELAQLDGNGVAVDSSGGDPADPAGDGNAVCLPLSIATAVALTGPNVMRDSSIRNGAQLAVDKHNAANPGCQVQLKLFDTAGDPAVAAGVVPEIVEDTYTVGVIGPSSAAEVVAMGGLFRDAGVVAATPSATENALSENGWGTFFRGLANDGVQGLSVANYMKGARGYRSVCVVDDGSDYGRELAGAVRQGLGPAARPDCGVSVAVDNGDPTSAVSRVDAVNPDAVFYAGHSGPAADFVTRLREGGVTATFVGGGASKDAAFAERAGDAANGSLLSCGCAPATGPFAEDYSQRFGARPASFAAEAYDLATIMLKGIDRGINTRPALLDFMHTYDGLGTAGRYQWTESGELTAPSIWIYEVQ